MTVPTSLEDRRVDAPAIVPHKQTQLGSCVLYFDFYCRCLRMDVSVYDCLPPDAVNFVPDLRSDDTRASLFDDSEHDCVLVRKLLFYVLKSLSQIIVFVILKS